jgi:hypothetical protein
MLNMPASTSGISRVRQNRFVIFMIFLPEFADTRLRANPPHWLKRGKRRTCRQGGAIAGAAHAVNILQTVKAVYRTR